MRTGMKTGDTYAWTHILYMAALIVRLRTVFEFLDAQPTWMGCATGTRLGASRVDSG